MRQSTRYSLVIVILLTFISIIPSRIHAQAFEGEITMLMSSPTMGEQKIKMIYLVKGDNVLQTADDPKNGKVLIYTDTKTGTQTIVMEAQKHGMQIDQSLMDDAIQKMHMPVLLPKATGKKQKISRYNCELFTIMIDSTQQMDIWLTKDFPKDISQAIRKCTELGMKNTGVKSDALIELFKSGYAQVRMEMKIKGVTQLTNEFAKADAEKLDDAIYSIPADIKIEKLDPKLMTPGAEQK